MVLKKRNVRMFHFFFLPECRICRCRRNEAISVECLRFVLLYFFLLSAINQNIIIILIVGGGEKTRFGFLKIDIKFLKKNNNKDCIEILICSNDNRITFYINRSCSDRIVQLMINEVLHLFFYLFIIVSSSAVPTIIYSFLSSLCIILRMNKSARPINSETIHRTIHFSFSSVLTFSIKVFVFFYSSIPHAPSTFHLYLVYFFIL